MDGDTKGHPHRHCSLEGNSYGVDPAFVGRRVELRYDPEDLSRIDVYLEGKPAGVATPFVIGRHTHRSVPQAKRPEPQPTGIDYLGMVATYTRRPPAQAASTSPSFSMFSTDEEQR